MNHKNHLIRHIGTAIAECPLCRRRKLLPIADMLGKMEIMEIDCACGNVFALQLEFRKHKRKSTKFQGCFIKGGKRIRSKIAVDNGKALRHTESGHSKNCTVTNVSFGGIAFEVWGPHSIRVGEKLHLTFHLDNKKYTLIQCEVIVKSVNKERIGAAFSERINKPEYGFYLWDEEHSTLSLQNPVNR